MFQRPSAARVLAAEHRVADAVAPTFAAAALAGLRKAQAVPLHVLRTAWTARNLHAVERALPWAAIQRVWQARWQRASVTALVAAARAHARLLPRRLLKAEESEAERLAREATALQQLELAVGTAFNLRNPAAIRWAETHAAELVSSVSAETQAAIRAVVLRMWNEGLTVDQAARALRPLIGLTERQALAADNYRAALAAQDLPPSLVLERTADYAARLLRQRATLIGRTESIRASVAGQQVLWDEAQRTGLLEGDRTRQQWLVTPDERLCPICESLGAADPVPVGGIFPGGYTAPPAHPACRCALRLVFD